MGLLTRLLGARVPAWAIRSPHDAESAANLVAAIERYVTSSGGTATIAGDAAKISGPRGERSYLLHEFVFICPADAPDTWERMLSVALRDVIPEPALLREARISCERILERSRSELELIATRDVCLESLRIAIRVKAFRAEIPDLVTTAVCPAFDRFEGVAVYGFLPQLDGVPAEHASRFGLEPKDLIERARDNTFASLCSSAALGIEGPFAGSRILDPTRVAPSGPHGMLIAAPHRDLLLHHSISDSSVLSALDAMATRAHEQHSAGPSGGTGRSLYWWRSGSFREIPTTARAIVRAGQRPYEPRPPDQFKREVLKPLGVE